MVGITISGLCHEYESCEVFRAIDFDYCGDCLAVTGRNGSGKSTLLRIIAGLLTPTSGRVQVSVDGARVDRSGLRSIVGLLAPDVRLYSELSARENLRFILRARGYGQSEEAIDSILDVVQLSDRGNDLLSELSSGLRQRANLAAALICRPRLLLMDEPFSNLDDDGKSVVRKVVEAQRTQGMVVIATNDENEADLCSQRLHLGERR